MDMPRPRRPRLLNRDHFVAIDQLMDEDHKMTTCKLKDKLLNQFPGLQISDRTATRWREELGWLHQTAKYAQLV